MIQRRTAYAPAVNPWRPCTCSLMCTRVKTSVAYCSKFLSSFKSSKHVWHLFLLRWPGARGPCFPSETRYATGRAMMEHPWLTNREMLAGLAPVALLRGWGRLGFGVSGCCLLLAPFEHAASPWWFQCVACTARTDAPALICPARERQHLSFTGYQYVSILIACVTLGRLSLLCALDILRLRQANSRVFGLTQPPCPVTLCNMALRCPSPSRGHGLTK